MENKILNKLKNSTEYISGETLSLELNVSRSAIWKHIKTLKNKGYVIDGISNKGYKLMSSPNTLFPSEIDPLLKTKEIAKTIQYYFELPSTNKTAKQLADNNNANNGTLIIAEKQTLGKGRFDRKWTSPSSGIWMSLILKPNIPPSEASKITQIAAASVYKALLNFGINVSIKWPNDIFINGKKLCGILTEMKCDIDRIHYLVLGIGLNVNLNAEEITDELKDIATSLKLEFNKTFSKSLILSEILNNFEPLYEKFILENNICEVLNICRQNSNLLNQKAKLITYHKEEIVTCIGINDNGELIVKDADGYEKAVTSGEISFRV
ncbi:UNVERIFIED_ORG: bifunctional biotin--[acetyl-CoA-carboxylase] synthetase/biotin operon repressor [Clostridium botulinum]|uniref:biotin--[acetyl-CoA-carboxylase] ligase n=1 Tax=Clostridium botulinum TaxID=1491 RepID=UPI00059712D0|nr:biotin--[acetyl-CoA-carboxylase] ligase [Clostridium botulinum]KIL06797.1 biotin--acetyl-CoA-carboxylase ligase [Clostridium botulinum]MBY6934734.1 biotin--[acetyl-CoA-carboxylase] ligase [Clostridium botulinum]NFL84650.1 biotin--[acetyl-CoA-carboxylase] ligase [Clostridium botulinum]NFN11669.1 biotin--[acetyl-CoA-carboxylase] ligase [Clostridium botulinum]NFO36194.1 biotin--[acetyl-CoA-carboxylase] ligase [Clostridium botulinum]